MVDYMVEQAIIDMPTYNQLKDMMGAEFVVELIDTYTKETDDLIEQLGQALTAGEAVSFGRFAHSIKSSSASLGALDFSQQARELEMMGKTNDLTGAGEKLEKLAGDFLQVKQRLEDLKHES
jgi:HPt (histidine-containing phosphotransfer) domain-containing protein